MLQCLTSFSWWNSYRSFIYWERERGKLIFFFCSCFCFSRSSLKMIWYQMGSIWGYLDIFIVTVTVILYYLVRFMLLYFGGPLRNLKIFKQIYSSILIKHHYLIIATIWGLLIFCFPCLFYQITLKGGISKSLVCYLYDLLDLTCFLWLLDWTIGKIFWQRKGCVLTDHHAFQ